MIHSPKADVYAMGIVLWELLCWCLPWEDMGTFQVRLLLVCCVMAMNNCKVGSAHLCRSQGKRLPLCYAELMQHKNRRRLFFVKRCKKSDRTRFSLAVLPDRLQGGGTSAHAAKTRSSVAPSVEHCVNDTFRYNYVCCAPRMRTRLASRLSSCPALPWFDSCANRTPTKARQVVPLANIIVFQAEIMPLPVGSMLPVRRNIVFYLPGPVLKLRTKLELAPTEQS